MIGAAAGNAAWCLKCGEMLPKILTIGHLRALYAGRPSAIFDVLDEMLARIHAARDKAVFISLTDPSVLRLSATNLLRQAPDTALLPLWGIPFAVKDNIDVAGMDTTAACPAFAYRAKKDATVVARLKAVGALVVGKTNLDQFATGLNGTRSPYGAPRCVFDANYISGGSSSGSAVAVASGLVPFALGTDTAGSGRVPAAFNNIVGIKPTGGLLSMAGVLPACRSLDCVSILSTSLADGLAVRRAAEGFDPADPFSLRKPQRALLSQLRVGVLSPNEREFYGDAEYAALYASTVEIMRGLGAEIVEFDYRPFLEIGALLYEGPWLAERLVSVGSFVDAHPHEVNETVRKLLAGAHRHTAADAFSGMHRFKELSRAAEAEWAKAQILLLPTAPTIYKIEEMLADPVRLNARLGRYTQSANFLGCPAIAVPAGFRKDGLPFGVTLVAPPFHDDDLAKLAAALHEAANCGAGIAWETQHS
jgi:allophanate hydrolase